MKSAQKAFIVSILVPFFSILFPSLSEPSHRSSITALAPVEVVADGFRDVRGIVAGEEGSIYVTDREAETATKIAPSGVKTVLLSRLKNPRGLAFDLQGRLLVAEKDAGRVLQLEPSGALTVLLQDIGEPRWLALGEDSTLYISTRALAGQRTRWRHSSSDDSEAILALSPTGELKIFAQGFRDLEGIVVSDGTLFAATTGLRSQSSVDGVIFMIPILPDGSAGPLSQLGPSNRYEDPIGLVLDPLGALYLTSEEAEISRREEEDAIVKLFPDGTISLFASDLRDPRGLAFDAQGNLLVADGSSGKVLRIRAPPPPVLAVPSFTNQSQLTVTGTSVANSRIDAFLNDSSTPTTILTSDGNFSLTLNLKPETGNALSVFSTAQSGNGLTGAPAKLTIVSDDTVPLIANLTPQSGSFINNPTPQLRADFSDGGSGVDVNQVTIRLDGVDITAQANITASGFTFTPSTPLSEGQHTASVTVFDFAGNAASASSTFTVDVTAPLIANLNPADGATLGSSPVTVTGTITETLSGIASIGCNGNPATLSDSIFTCDVPLADGANTIVVDAIDAAGNAASSGINVSLVTLGVEITSPSPGSAVNTPTVFVQGIVDVPPGTEVGATVNGSPAAVQGNTFTALIPVSPETTSLTIVATVAGGATTSQTIAITVTDTATPSALLHASPASGVAPLTVNFSLFGGSTPVQVELDADGDGVVDFSGSELSDIQEQSFTYTQPGVYVATARVTDIQGLQFDTSAVVQVYDRAVVDTLLQAKWASMKDALTAGDIPQALAQIVAPARDRYAALFNGLGTRVSEFGTNMPAIQPVYFEGTYAKYRLQRQEQVGGNVMTITYYVYFSIDHDGIWRIQSF